MRTPSSCVRCDTEYAVTPNTPIAAINSASAANPINSTIVKRSLPMPASMIWSIVWMLKSGRFGSIS